MLREVTEDEFRQSVNEGLVLADFFFQHLRSLQDAFLRAGGCGKGMRGKSQYHEGGF